MSYGTSPLRLFDETRGTNQSGVRVYNERLILSLVRRSGELAKAEIARLTGLSPQTTTVIVNRLEADGLLIALPRKRGGIGQPTVPYKLNPKGAYSLGLKIGRRSSDLILTDFTGAILEARHMSYDFPEADSILAFALAGIDDLTLGMVTGLGIACPFELWNWEEELETPKGALAHWKTRDIRAEIEAKVTFPVLFCNDATAACAAELMFGATTGLQDYLYFYIGSFIGGGVVLNGSLHPGRTGNAGAMGSMPVHNEQLINFASIHLLEKRLGGLRLSDNENLWQKHSTLVDIWLEEAAKSLSVACVSAVSVIDFEAIVIDGAFPAFIRDKFVARVLAHLQTANLQGLSPFNVLAGSLGRNARALGGASLPLIANFGREREVLFKEGVSA
jgi:predicted NBD/HSP70 family sugar kinase